MHTRHHVIVLVGISLLLLFFITLFPLSLGFLEPDLPIHYSRLDR